MPFPGRSILMVELVREFSENDLNTNGDLSDTSSDKQHFYSSPARTSNRAINLNWK